MVAEIYTSDWFGRTNVKYTYNVNHHGIVNFNDDLYSSFLYNEDKAERICNDEKLLRNEILDMVHALNLNGVSIKLSKTCETACTNGKYIEIGIGDDYVNIDNCYDKLDRIIGMTIHECCHCLYTDFTYLKRVIGLYPEVVHHIHNVIEDEMIEHKLCIEYPGYENFLSKLKYNIFEKNSNDDLDKEDTDPAKILRILFYVIRYPKYLEKIDESLLNKYADTFVKIKDILKTYNCFSDTNNECTKSSTAAAIKIYELIYNECLNNQDNNSGNNDSVNNSNDDNSSNNSSNNSNKSSENGNESDNKDNSSTGNDIDNELNNAKIVEILNKILEEISSESEQVNEQELNIYHQSIEDSHDTYKRFEWKKIGDSVNVNPNVHEWTEDNPRIYNMYLNDVRNYIDATKKLIINNKKTVEYRNDRFNRNGSLDPTRLANAMCNESTVFIRRHQIEHYKDAEYALGIIVDESGSMDHRGINRLASKIAIMLYEAMSTYKRVKLFVYGHGDCVYKYIDPINMKNKYVLGDRRSQGGQDELISYATIVDDIKRYTNLPIVIFNITDSCYCSNEQKLANLVNNLRNDPKQKTYINLICLGHDNNTNNTVSGWNNVIYGEGNWVIYDSNVITFEIVNMLKKISEIIHRTIKL